MMTTFLNNSNNAQFACDTMKLLSSKRIPVMLTRPWFSVPAFFFHNEFFFILLMAFVMQKIGFIHNPPVDFFSTFFSGCKLHERIEVYCFECDHWINHTGNVAKHIFSSLSNRTVIRSTAAKKTMDNNKNTRNKINTEACTMWQMKKKVTRQYRL